ncbi:MAG: ABC transporter ATP-binding protein [Alphaproteobacteria bacterium]|nr:ABC transporter ATP-binding protein [Alphaproteobacteria bacterium]
MSIELIDIAKSYRIGRKRHLVFEGLNLFIPKGRSVGLLGPNGAGKSTLLRMIGGSELPDRGRVVRNMTVSWPVGFSGFFQGNLSGVNNARFCARIYGRDPDEVVREVADFAELGGFMKAPIRTYSTGMRARLGFGLSMAIDFDCLLIDEILAVGDAGFRQKAQAALDQRRQRSGIILVSHATAPIIRNCDMVVVLGFGAPFVSDDVAGVAREYDLCMRSRARAA